MKTKIILFISLLVISGCVKNIGNGEPPYINIYNSIQYYYTDSVTDYDTLYYDLIFESKNGALLGSFFIKNLTDSSFYEQTIEDTNVFVFKTFYYPKLNNKRDSLVSFYVKVFSPDLKIFRDSYYNVRVKPQNNK